MKAMWVWPGKETLLATDAIEIAERETLVVTVISGPSVAPVQVKVSLAGVTPDTKLTPKLAEQAARIAFGHRSGVTVIDKNGDGYRLYANSVRNVYAAQP